MALQAGFLVRSLSRKAYNGDTRERELKPLITPGKTSSPYRSTSYQQLFLRTESKKRKDKEGAASIALVPTRTATVPAGVNIIDGTNLLC